MGVSKKRKAPAEALRELMGRSAAKEDRSALTNSEVFARQLLRQALEGDAKAQKLILELPDGVEEAAGAGEDVQEHPARLELVLRVVEHAADTGSDR